MKDKIALLEAALFLSPEPLSIDQISKVLGIGSKGFVRDLIEKYREILNSEERGLELFETNGKFELKVKRELIDKVAHLAPHQDISEGVLRTLALIAYESPIEQSKVVEIRGNRAYDHIKELKARGFIESIKKGKTHLLQVTKQFLDYFGLETPEEFRMHVKENT